MKVIISKAPSKKAASTAQSSSQTQFEFESTSSTTILAIKKEVAKRFPKLTIERQRLTIPDKKIVLEDKKTLGDYSINNGDVIHFKDLGPQIAWKTVFLIEYFGPIVIHSLFYHFPRVFFLQSFKHSNVQRALYWMAVAHYLKRELETILVHRFSHATMPFSNIYKNCFHYYFFGGALLAFFNYGPKFKLGSPTDLATSNSTILLSIVLFTFFELSNLSTHITLKNLRPPGSTVRRIPYGYGFTMVSCPNYLFEILSWASYALIAEKYSSLIFLTVSAVQMYLWAVKKHKAYLKEFPNYPKSRKAIFPYLA
ncbi:hypothetical protein BB559_005764 [Furculomyces boomerangus]|uniref:Ubiquitin-like domain-containing protein n=2 Tax=Harpellales TaxID=61421 RepID=A0A2T9Y6N0_9FUNG|nr:hypothetical protein BB559_005764 [Furculomyces boomerangus]PVZ98126.1 hypothetical protein BB558_005892 [Smittium angustum]